MLFEQALDESAIVPGVFHFNVVRSEGVNGFHPVRGDMFIDRGAKTLRLRSEERNGSGAVKLWLNSAPSNGVVLGI